MNNIYKFKHIIKNKMQVVLLYIIFSFDFCAVTTSSIFKCSSSNTSLEVLGELIFNMLVLVGTIKILDRIVRKVMDYDIIFYESY